MTQQYNKNISEKEVVEEFRNRREKITRLAVTLGIIAGAIVIMTYTGVASKTTAAFLLVVFFISTVFVHLKIWRCPSCNGHLGRLYLGLKEPKHCPNCGIRLIER